MMKNLLLGTAGALALGLTLPAVAQQKATESKKIEIPKGVFYAGLGPTQYLAKARLIGQPVVDKAGTRIAVVDDVIMGSKDNKVDGLIIDAGGKKLGVRITAAKIETKDGKTTIMLPEVTGEMLKSSLPPFGAKAPAK
jgi:sporulation protein YlmC with PRC-barrel domain